MHLVQAVSKKPPQALRATMDISSFSSPWQIMSSLPVLAGNQQVLIYLAIRRLQYGAFGLYKHTLVRLKRAHL